MDQSLGYAKTIAPIVLGFYRLDSGLRPLPTVISNTNIFVIIFRSESPLLVNENEMNLLVRFYTACYSNKTKIILFFAFNNIDSIFYLLLPSLKKTSSAG